MALTATLALDIRAFEGGLSRATASLEGFAQKTVKNTNRDLSRMLEEFTGQRVVAESAKMVEAVERIGGASKLTEAEQRRVNATVTEAIEKYRVLGQEAPDSLMKLQSATAHANTGTSTLTGTVGRLAAAFSVANLIDKGVSALFSFGTAALKSAGELSDLSKATGVSTSALQRWGHVAQQGGIELEVMTKASFKLGAAGDSVRDAVEGMGLAWDTFKAAKPDQQLDMAMIAAGKLGSEVDRNTALTELFGSRAAIELARVVDGYEATASAASIAGDAQVAALARAGDAWDRMKARIGTGIVGVLGTASAWAEDSVAAFELATKGLGEFNSAQKIVIANIINAGGEGLAEFVRKVRAVTTSVVAAIPPQRDYTLELQRQLDAVRNIKPAVRDQIAAAQALGEETSVLADRFGVTEAQIRILNDQTREAETRQKQFAQEGIRKTKEEAREAAAATKQFWEEVERLNDRTKTAIITTGKWEFVLKDTVGLLERSTFATGTLWKEMEKWANQQGAVFAGTAKMVGTSTTESEGFLSRLKVAFGEAGGSAQSMSQLFMQAFTGGGGATGALKAFATQGVQALMSMIPGIPPWLTQFAGPIVEGLSKLAAKGRAILASMFGGPSSSEKAGRASVAAFEQSLHGALTATQELESGGEDWRRTVIAIRDAYIAAGRTEQEALAAAEKLWKSSTISAEESRRVIEEIKAAMNALPTTKTIEIDVKYNDDGLPSNPGGLPTNATQPVGPSVPQDSTSIPPALPYIPPAPPSSAMGQMGASQAPVVVVVTTIRRDDIDPVEIGNMAAAAVAQHYPRNGFDLKTIITDSLREA